MKASNYAGYASFWKTAYYRNSYYLSNPKVVKHETKHLEDIDRDGIIKYAIMYSYYQIKYGRHDNPYEVAARKAEDA